LKIHKVNNPLRPTVNWTNAPAYNSAKKRAKNVVNYTPLPYAFNIKNSTYLMKDLLDIPYNNNLKLASPDITNMYTNIPTNEIPVIIQNICTTNNINLTKQTEIIHLSNIIMNQNYFQFNKSFYTQKNRISNGRPHLLNFLGNIFTTSIKHHTVRHHNQTQHHRIFSIC
jgi:hypothetical protein